MTLTYNGYRFRIVGTVKVTIPETNETYERIELEFVGRVEGE